MNFENVIDVNAILSENKKDFYINNISDKVKQFVDLSYEFYSNHCGSLIITFDDFKYTIDDDKIKIFISLLYTLDKLYPNFQNMFRELGIDFEDYNYTEDFNIDNEIMTRDQYFEDVGVFPLIDDLMLHKIDFISPKTILVKYISYNIERKYLRKLMTNTFNDLKRRFYNRTTMNELIDLLNSNDKLETKENNVLDLDGINIDANIYKYIINILKTYYFLRFKLEGEYGNKKYSELIILSCFIVSSFDYPDLVECLTDFDFTNSFIEKKLDIIIDKEYKYIERIELWNKKIEIEEFLTATSLSLDENSTIESVFSAIFSLFNPYDLFGDLFFQKTGIRLKNGINKINNDNEWHKEKVTKMELIKKHLPNLNYYIYDFIYYFANYYAYFRWGFSSKKLDENDRILFSLLYSLNTFNPKITNYMNNIYCNNDNMNQFFNMNQFIINYNNLSEETLKEVIDLFKCVIEYVNKDDITLDDIINFIIKHEYHDAITFNSFLNTINLPIDSLFDINDKTNSYIEKTNQEREIRKYIEFLKQNNLYDLCTNASVYYSELKNLKDNEESLVLAFILAYLKLNEDECVYLTDNNLNAENIFNYIKCKAGVELIYPSSISYETIIINDLKPFLNKFNINNFKEEIKELLKPYIDHTDSQDTEEITNYSLISKIIDKSELLKDICEYYNGDYETLKEEFFSKKKKEKILSKEEMLTSLQEVSVPNIDALNLSSLIDYGDELIKHSNMMSKEWENLVSANNDDTLEEINKLINNMYTTTPAVVQSATFFEQLFGKKNQIIEPEKKEINKEVIDNLKNKLNETIESLKNEFASLEYLRVYIELYLSKLNDYIYKLQSELNADRQENLKDTDNDLIFSKSLHQATYLKILQDKLNRFETSKALYRQELIKINQMMVNHFITIDSLKTSKEIILPLVGSEMILLVANATENTALDLSDTVVGLLQGVINQNAVATKANLDRLKNTNIPEATLSRLTDDIGVYLNEIKEKQISYDKDAEDKKKLTYIKRGEIDY